MTSHLMRVRQNYKRVLKEMGDDFDELRRFGFIWSFADEPVPVSVKIADIQTEVMNPTPLCELDNIEGTKSQGDVIDEWSDGCGNDELEMLHLDVTTLTKEIEEALKAGEKQRVHELRVKRRELWQKIEEQEMLHGKFHEGDDRSVCEMECEAPIEEVQLDPRGALGQEMEEKIFEIRNTYFSQHEITPQMLELLNAITTDRNASMIVTWPHVTDEFVCIALIAGIAVEGVHLMLAPDPVSLHSEIEQDFRLYPKSKFVFSVETLQRPPSIIFVFEFHCASKLSVFFVDQYMENLLAIASRYPSSRFVLFSSLASKSIEDDMSKILLLGFRSFRSSFQLSNVFLGVREKKDTEMLVSIIQQHDCSNGRGIIMCSSVRECEKVTLLLNGNKIPSAFLYSLMTEDQSKEVIINWQEGNIRVIIMIIGYVIPKTQVDYIIYSGLPINIEMLYLHLKHVVKFCAICFNKTDVIITKRNITDQSAFDSVLSFVQEKRTCRKQQICSYFGETTPLCLNECDNCQARKMKTTQSIINEARIPELIDHLHTYRCASASIPFITSILCGNLTNSHLIDQVKPWFGTVAPERAQYIEGAINELVRSGILNTHQTNNQYGNKTYFTTNHY